MKKMAVIMSLYKNDKLSFLRQAVSSVLTQTFCDFDFYIQCDGPINNDCITYLKELNDERVYVRERSVNKGLAYSLNELLQEEVLSKNYEFIARMDADDISLKDRFQEQMNVFEKDSELDCLGTWAIEIDEDGVEYFRKEMPKYHEDCLKLFEIRDCLIHPTVMFRRTFFEKSGLYPLDTYFGEDTIMWKRGFKNGCKFGNVEMYLLNFRLDKNFFDRRRGWKHAKEILNLRSRVIKELNFGTRARVYAILYAVAKLMPTKMLNLIYKKFR